MFVDKYLEEFPEFLNEYRTPSYSFAPSVTC